jgi:uncharacterized membrane protein YfcA
MFEIQPQLRPMATTLIAVGMVMTVIAALLLRRTPAAAVRKAIGAAMLAGVLLTAAGTLLWSRRHAGTGTQTDWGWPKAIYGSWVDFEGRNRAHEFRLSGAVADVLVFGAGSLLVIAAARRSRSRSESPRPH